jgi:uncharacterized heparinase superfamily protein
LRLSIKRNLSQRFSETLNQRYLNRKVSPRIGKEPPFPVFAPRKGKFTPDEKASDRFALSFLNKSKTFRYPLDWHPKEFETGTRLWKLNLHYMEFLEEVDDEWFCRFIKDWIKQNPPYREGYWFDAWNSFALSIRTVIWMQQIALRKGQLETEFLQQTAESIWKQLDFLENNLENDIKGNHLVKNIKALLWGSAFFDENENTVRWRKIGEKLLKSIIKHQILPDGMHYERSPAYHCQVLADLLECYSLLESSSLKSELDTCLKKMGEALANLTHPDGKISLFNDGGLSMSYKPGEIQEKLKALTGAGASPSREIKLQHAGYYGLQLSDLYFLYDAGKIGPDELPAHGHGDIFSFELSLGSQRIFVDKGVYEYSKGYHRTASRSTLSHNTVNLVHLDQCEFYDSFRVGRRANVSIKSYESNPESIRIVASHDGYQRLRGKPVHCRTIDLQKESLIVEDEISGGEGLRTEARLLLHPDVMTEKSSDGSVVLRAGDRKLVLYADHQTGIRTTVWYPDFGVALPTKQIIVYLGTAPCQSRFQIVIKS